ncbi:cyclase family protein [Microbacterium sp. BR1]|uniref:cyclase family protein n=1 Tax=Microbacterium sp. BR1 TaxID=1070896 RepID=UPI000C2B769A|nr:cyclase family protein [Microbacterium sp. BR1]
MCEFDARSSHDAIAALIATAGQPTKSPFGKDDQIGMLNAMTPASQRLVAAEADFGRPFDMAVSYFPTMPSWTAAGDPSFQIWMGHTPNGNLVDDGSHQGRAVNELVSYSGDSFMMYTHTGTHIDTLNHYGYGGVLWNGFTEREHLGSRGWTVSGPELYPPIVARGVLVDVAATHGVDVLPDSYAIGADDLKDALRRQGSEIRRGDVVMVRTGRMSTWPDPERFMAPSPGINLDGARYLAEAGAMIVGADNLVLEHMPSEVEGNWVPVHTYLLVEAGVPIMEVVDTEELSHESVYEFAFIGAAMPLTGATAAPMRPVAYPLARR